MTMKTCSSLSFHPLPNPASTSAPKSAPNSASLSEVLFAPSMVSIVAQTRRQESDRQRGFSLPEVMVSLLLVMLGASAVISTMAVTRMRANSTAKLSAVVRLAAELSDWTRQGGMRAFAVGTENPFDLVDASDTVQDCFSHPCNAEDAALFYLHHWRRRLLLEVRDAHIVVCRGMPATRADDFAWGCEEADPNTKSRVIKIGWDQGSGVGPHGSAPRIIFALV